MLYVPKGFAHGFQALEDDCEVLYMMGEYYRPESGRGIRWDDSKIGIHWPMKPKVIDKKDATYGDFK